MNTKAALGALCAIAFATTITNAEPFTYQGSLNDSGSPANGEYDLNFRLYNAQAGGAQIGPQVVRENTQVTDGVFTVELDFGDDVFQATPRYLEIEIRPGDSGAIHDILSPRTPINPAPAAQHATTADALTNPIWNESGSVISAGDGLSRVLINRDTPITPSEYFGVHAETTGFVGMYISGPAGSFPFYGYSVDGEISAYSFFNGNDNSWSLVMPGGTALRVNSSNIAEFAQPPVASAYEFSSPKTSYHSISGEIFHAASSDTFFASGGTGGAYITNPGSGWLVAPVTLPHGATVTRMRVYANDVFAGGSMTITLQQQAHGGDFFGSLASVSTTGLNGTNLEIIDNSIGSTINNNTSHYHMRVFSSSWPGTLDMRIKSVVIEYTTTEAD